MKMAKIEFVVVFIQNSWSAFNEHWRQVNCTLTKCYLFFQNGNN